MSDDFLASVQVEGDMTSTEKTDEQVTETPVAPPTEQNQTEQPPSPQGGKDESGETQAPAKSNTEDDNNLPFHKNPRWQQMVEERNALKKSVEELTESVQQVHSRIPELDRLKQPETVQIPKWFSDLYGDNPEAYKSYQADLDARLDAREKQLSEKREQERRKESEESQRWNSWVKDSVSKIETNHNVSLAEGSPERNEFMAYVLKLKPSDDEGNIDFLKGWEEFSEKKELLRLRESRKEDARKEVAAKTTSRSTPETPKSEYLTMKDLRHKSFRDLAR